MRHFVQTEDPARTQRSGIWAHPRRHGWRQQYSAGLRVAVAGAL